MSGNSPWSRAAARLLQLAPATAAQEQTQLQPLLEALLQCQHQGAEPLNLSAQTLESLTPAAREGLSALPLMLVERPEGGAELWSRRQHQQHQRMRNLPERHQPPWHTHQEKQRHQEKAKRASRISRAAYILVRGH